jgi:hypothetical protein
MILNQIDGDACRERLPDAILRPLAGIEREELWTKSQAEEGKDLT